MKRPFGARIAPSEITPEPVFWQRRRLLKSAAALGTVGLVGCGVDNAEAESSPAVTKTPLSPLEVIKSTDYAAGETKTPEELVTSYNNFYELGLDKSDPARNASWLKTANWQVEVGGACAKPGVVGVEDLVNFNALEERIYRLRCVEAWSMVVPWVGVTLADILKPFEPKALYEKLSRYQAFERDGQVLFVSVDADRDTPDVLRNYTDYFNPEFLAATAPAEELYQLTAQFGMQFMKISGDKEDEYFYDHPSSILLVGPDNRVTAIFSPPMDAGNIAKQIREIVDWGEKRN